MPAEQAGMPPDLKGKINCLQNHAPPASPS